MSATRRQALPDVLTAELEYLNLSNLFSLKTTVVTLYLSFLNLTLYRVFTTKKLLGSGFIYLRGLVVVFFIDALLTDDEPIWEPVEWSLVQN